MKYGWKRITRVTSWATVLKAFSLLEKKLFPSPPGWDRSACTLPAYFDKSVYIYTTRLFYLLNTIIIYK